MRHIFLLLFITFSTVAYAQNHVDKSDNSSLNKTLISKNLKISVNKDTGSFIFYAKDLNTDENKKKSDDWIKLLSEKTIASSCFMFLKDGVSIGYGDGEKGVHTCQIKWNEIKYAWENANTRIISTFNFIQNRKTASYDGFNINLNIKNISKEQTELTPIACFDANNDKLDEHYFTSNRKILNEQELLGSNIKDNVVINTLIEHTALKLFVPNITFANSENEAIHPKRIFFTNWRRMQDNKSGIFHVSNGRPFSTEPYTDNDSGLFIEYPSTKIKPNDSIIINFRLDMEYAKISASSQAKLEELFQLLKEVNKKIDSNEIVEKKYLNDLDDRLNELR